MNKKTKMFLACIILMAITGSAWAGLGTWKSIGPLNGNIYGVQAFTTFDGNIVVGGDFTDANSISDADHVVLWNSSVYTSIGGPSGFGQINTLAVYDENLYWGGWVGTQQFGFWDKNSWTNLSNFSGSPSKTVSALVEYDGNLVVAGQFSGVIGIPNTSGIALWDGTNWHSIGNIGSIYALAVYDGNLYVGGTFTDANGIVFSNKITMWDGNAWHKIVQGLNSDVRSFAVLNGELYVGGYFNNLGGIADCDYLCVWNGSTWRSIGSLGGGVAAYNVYALTVHDFGDSNKLVVGGNFEDANGIEDCDNLCIFDGTGWSSIGPMVDSLPVTTPEIYALTSYNDELLAGGNFIDMNNIAEADNVAVYYSHVFINVLLPGQTGMGDWNILNRESIAGIVFDVGSASNSDELHLKLSYSAIPGDFSNLIVADVNLNSADANLSCTDKNWASNPRCTYTWGIESGTDEFVFVDANVWIYNTNENYISSSNGEFGLDGESPYWIDMVPPNGSDWISKTIEFEVEDGMIGMNDCNISVNGTPISDFNILEHCSLSGTQEPANGLYATLYCNYTANEIHKGSNTVVADCNDSFGRIGTETTTFNYLPGISIQFWDENTQAKIVPTTITMNGSNILGYLDSNGALELSFDLLSDGYYTIKASKANYTEREWTFLVSPSLSITYDANFALLPTVLGRDVPFEFYLPDTITRVASTLVAVWNTDGNFVSSIISTNALGQVQFFLNAQDENYRFDFNYASTLYAYGETLVTVKIPKDEQTLALINPWNLTVDGITFWDFNGLTTDKNVYVFSDLYGYHYFDVNATGYFERSYALRFKGGVATYVLQPYLVNQTTGLNVAFYFVNDLTGAALGDVTMILKKNIPGEGFVTVESVESDDAGKVVISAVYNNRYTAFFYYNGTLIKTNDYLMNSSTYTVALVLWGITYHDPTRSGVYMTFTKPYVITYLTDYNLQGKLYADFAGVNHVNTIAKYNGTTIASYSKDLNANAIGSTDLNALISVSGLDYNTTITIVWTIEATLSDGNTVVSSQIYTFRITGSPSERNDFLHTMSVDVPADLGCPVGSPCPILIIISLFVAMIVVGLLSTTIHVDFTSLSIIAVAILGFFVMTNWVPFGLWIVLCLAAGLTTIASRRVLK